MIACDRRGMLSFVAFPFRCRDLLSIVWPWEAGLPGDVSEDVYLTDGRLLFRVISRLYETGGPEAVLEDCATLEVQIHTAGELWDMGLRRVQPGAGLDAQGAGR